MFYYQLSNDLYNKFSRSNTSIYKQRHPIKIICEIPLLNTKNTMKQSYIYEKTERPSLRRVQNPRPSFQRTHCSSGAAQVKPEILQNVFKLMQLILTRQQQIQTYKQLLTQRPDFNPQALYHYISRDQPLIDKRHLMLLLEENNISSTEQQIKLYLNSYGYKERFDYSAFVNLIFPVDVKLLKYISVTGIKKYSIQTTVTQQVLCLIIMLIQEEIRLIDELDALKCQLLPRISRKDIRNIMRTMKKNGQCNSQMEIQSQSYVKYEQLKILFKNLIIKHSSKTVPNSARKPGKKMIESLKDQKQSLYTNLQKNLACVFRKISMGKNNFINLQDLQFWLRPWGKNKSPYGGDQLMNNQLSNVFQISGIDQVSSNNQSQLTLRENISFPLSHLCC